MTLAKETQLKEALIDATVHLVAAVSAYRTYTKRHHSMGRAKTDPFFTTRIVDFEKAVERAQAAVRKLCLTK
jgi:hypothetical protein